MILTLARFPGRIVLTTLWFVSGARGPRLGRDWTADLPEATW